MLRLSTRCDPRRMAQPFEDERKKIRPNVGQRLARTLALQQ
jgi:hypothetical protein